jgi:hypothetical protein
MSRVFCACPVLSIPMVVLLAPAAVAMVWVVNPNGTGDQPTIQAAITASSPGDVIELTDGTFRGWGNRDIRYLGKAVTIRSQSGDAASCVIDVGASSQDQHRGFDFRHDEGPGSVLENVTVTHGYLGVLQYPLGHGAAILMEEASPTIRGCTFTENYAEVGAAIVTGGGAPRIEQCRFTNNQAAVISGAIDISGGHVWIEGCVISGNESQGGGAISMDDNSTVVIRGCTISGNHALIWGGGLFSAFSGVLVDRSILWGNCADADGDDLWMGTDAEVGFACSLIDLPGIHGPIRYDETSIEGDQLFCGPISCRDAPTAKGDFHVDAASPVRAAASLCGQLIGALDAGCGASAGTGELDPLGSTALFLAAPAPNPTTGRVSIRFDLPDGGPVLLRLIDVTGRPVRTLLDRGLSPGRHELAFDLTDPGRPPLARGIYYLQLRCDGEEQVRKLVLAGR